VLKRFGTTDRGALKVAVDPALHAFNSARKRHLMLYPSVRVALEAVRGRGIGIVGHTEAIAVNAMYRLRYLGIENLFARLYALHGEALDHPDVDRGRPLEAAPGFVRVVPRDERKPNPRLLLDICEREGVEPRDAWYVGDSLTRDISMAKDAGVVAVWAQYGTVYDRELWNILVRVTHWTDEDVRREEQLRHLAARVSPDFIVGSFGEILAILDGGARDARGVGAPAKVVL
jgi:phosphoglycolate phosphatase